MMIFVYLRICIFLVDSYFNIRFQNFIPENHKLVINRYRFIFLEYQCLKLNLLKNHIEICSPLSEKLIVEQLSLFRTYIHR